MKITKFEHACFMVEENDESLIVDPGGFTTNLVIPSNVVAVVITHSHADHLDSQQLLKILDKNPDAAILGHQEVLAEISGTNIKTVTANEGIKMGSFELEFYGGTHAVIDPSIPVIANLGVMINGAVYYAGDSFVVPERPVTLLALPVAAPWMKISETAAFLKEVNPEIAVPTHDAILSETGKNLVDRLIPRLVTDTSIKYQRLVEPLDIGN